MEVGVADSFLSGTNRPLFRNDNCKIMFIVLFTATSYHCNAKNFKKRLNLGVGFYLDKGAFFEASQNKNPSPLGSFPGNPCRNWFSSK